jgi:hypothetical protein
MPKFHILNIRPENWSPCIKLKIFGIKVGAPTPSICRGDILFARRLRNGGPEYGVKGLWYLTKTEPVRSPRDVPWTDAQYASILHYSPLVHEFRGMFSEDFRGWQSTKITGLAQIRLNGSIIPLKSSEARDYLQNILNELGTELKVEADYLGRTVVVEEFLLEQLVGLGGHSSSTKRETPPPHSQPTPPPPQHTPTRSNNIDIVGARLECPILNYEPVNELGVVVLFGFYMQDLGFSHLEQIRSKFPDAIGMMQLPDGRLQRARIEFEYESKNFEQHNHDPNGCDIIICWVHNWRNCPERIRVFELKSFIENLEEN